MWFGALIDNEYVWTLPKLGGSILVAGILGVIVALGSAYQIYTTAVFRDTLIRKFQGKDKSEDRNK
jgi:hypothetical protein